MKSIHNNQKKILEFLQEHSQGSTLEDLVDHLGITKTAVKEHINRVQDLGYVRFIDNKGSVGRPRRNYFLSNEGIESFPKKYSWLSNVILEQLTKELTSEGLGNFMKKLADTVAASTENEFVNLKTPSQRLKKITHILNELGYKAVLKESNVNKVAVIEAVNCVYHSVAKEHPTLCQFDVRFIENTSGMQVKLERCIAKGDSVCRFCVTKP
jgi:DeoR family suf operon transcriptional repressor